MANDCVILAQVVPCDGGTGAATAGCKEARPICVESGGQDFVLARGDPFFDGRVHCRSNARILLDIAFFCHESSAPFQREFGSGQTAKSRLRLAIGSRLKTLSSTRNLAAILVASTDGKVCSRINGIAGSLLAYWTLSAMEFRLNGSAFVFVFQSMFAQGPASRQAFRVLLLLGGFCTGLEF